MIITVLDCGSAKLQAVKIIKEYLNLSLKEASDMVSSCPFQIKLDDVVRANELKDALLGIGCKIENIMQLKENEKQYYDKVVGLYSRYGENIPDADLMHLSVIEKELGISFQRSQEIFELVKNQAESDNGESSVSPVVEKSEDVDTVADVENKANISESEVTMSTPEKHSTSIKNESKFEKTETIVSSVVENKPFDEITTAHVEVLEKNSKLPNNEKPTQQVNAEEHTLDAENKDLIPVEDPGDINKWKVVFWYTIGFFTIIFWGIGLIIMIWETIVVIRHKNKQLKYTKYLIQRDKIK